ncbi:MAG: hypothetical protein RI919_910, partial [Actinomycetota bacterium]
MRGLLKKFYGGELNHLAARLEKSCPNRDHRHDESGQVVELDELLPAAVGGFAR